VIVAEQLTKRFGGRTAVDAVSFTVAPGEVVGFLGPNGAGKTTTLRLLAGVLSPSAGRAVVDGHDVAREPLAARRRLGYAPERPALHPEMTVARFLAFVAGMKDADHRRAPARAIEQVGLTNVADRRIGTLSKGFQQRVGLAQALLGDPPALLLDEPTVGLDPEQSAETRRLIRTLASTSAVLVSSHALAEVEQLCDRVVILHRGRVLAAGTPAALAARLRAASRVDVEATAPADALVRTLAEVPGVRAVDLIARVNGHARCRVELEAGVDARPLLATGVTGRGWELLALAPVEPSLEEAFIALVKDGETS
jgi:ABC-2 type transport system ATP-binding protein